jgi:hypothetical protein
VTAEPCGCTQDAVIALIERFMRHVAAVAPNHLRSTLVTIVEANLSHIDANYIARTIGRSFGAAGHRGAVAHMRHNPEITGIRIDEDIKAQMARNTEVAMRDDLVRLDQRFASCTTGVSTKRDIDDLFEELAGYRRVVKVTRDPVTGMRKTVVKMSGKVGSGNDDKAIAFQMAAYWPSEFLSNVKYREHW